jgi:hypothetical protein
MTNHGGPWENNEKCKKHVGYEKSPLNTGKSRIWQYSCIFHSYVTFSIAMLN